MVSRSIPRYSIVFLIFSINSDRNLIKFHGVLHHVHERTTFSLFVYVPSVMKFGESRTVFLINYVQNESEMFLCTHYTNFCSKYGKESAELGCVWFCESPTEE